MFQSKESINKIVVTNGTCKTSVLSTCFTSETKITSISVSVRLVTRVGEVTICDKLYVRQKFVKALESGQLEFSKLQFRSPSMYIVLSSNEAVIKLGVKSVLKQDTGVSGGSCADDN